jgi:hypothetical protein
MKKIVRNILVVLLTVGAFYFPAVSMPEVSAQASQDITVVNKTGFDIHALYMTPHKAKQWGEDILGVDTLARNDSVAIVFSRKEKAQLWDLRVEDADGAFIEWGQLNLREISSITLYYKNGKATAIFNENKAAPVSDLVPLKLFWNQRREDNFATGTSDGSASAKDDGYRFIRTEGCVFRTQKPGTVPLKLYYNVKREDNFITATGVGERSARETGYIFIRVEGYVYPNKQSGTVPLNLYYNVEREDNYSAGTGIGDASAIDDGYLFIRVEGYVFPAERCGG